LNKSASNDALFVFGVSLVCQKFIYAVNTVVLKFFVPNQSFYLF